MLATKCSFILVALAIVGLVGCGQDGGNQPNAGTRVRPVLTAGPPAEPSPDTSKLKIGDPAPNFAGIIGTDGQQHSLADFRDAKLVVLVFTCNHCPVARAYQERLIALQKDYGPKRVQLVAVNVNNLPEDRLDEMQKRAKEKGYNFPYLYDRTQKIGRQYDARKTPHVFVLDADRKIAYMGAIDDNQQEQEVKEHFLPDALDALLAGKRPPKEVTVQFGCGIKYE